MKRNSIQKLFFPLTKHKQCANILCKVSVIFRKFKHFPRVCAPSQLFGIKSIKIHIICRNVPVLENRKNCIMTPTKKSTLPSFASCFMLKKMDSGSFHLIWVYRERKKFFDLNKKSCPIDGFEIPTKLHKIRKKIKCTNILLRKKYFGDPT